MNIKEILPKVDHTLLTQTAVWAEVKSLCDDGISYGTASVCIPPSFVSRAAAYAAGRIKICTVIGFPNGYSTTAGKCFETRQAVLEGADEIDMVVNLGDVRAARFDSVEQELSAVRESAGGRVLKVIVETCLLTRDEKIAMCHIVSKVGADFIKTSTGFSTGGATGEDVALFRRYLAPEVKIKASGGIRTLEGAAALIEAGADRIGASALVALEKG